MKLKTAFTLIELLVVIAIIGILSGLIVVSMSGVTQKASLARSQAFSNSLKNALMLNIIGEWKFDGVTTERAATNADVIDTWGRVNDGVVPAAPGIPTVKTDSSCVYGSCMSFDGINDYISVSNSASLAAVDALTNNYSFSVWVKSSTPGTHRIIEKTNGLVYSISLQGSDTTLNAFIYDGTNSPGVSFGNVWSGNWRYIVLSVNTSTDKLYGYLDGNLLTPVTNTVTVSAANTAALYIGNNTGLTRPFNGLIDDIRIFNTAISTSQVKENYYLGLSNLLMNGELSKEEYAQRMSSLAIDN